MTIVRNRSHHRPLCAALIGLAAGLALFGAGAARADAYATYTWRVCASGATNGGPVFQTNAPASDFNGARNCDPDAGSTPPKSSWVGEKTDLDAGTIANGDFGRMHWSMPAHTTLAHVEAQTWQQLFGDMEYRLQVVGGSGARTVLVTHTHTNETPTALRWAPGSPGPYSGFESVLVCNAAGGQRCDASTQSYGGANKIDLLLSDESLPSAGTDDQSPALDSSWQSGARTLSFNDSDLGSGVRLEKTIIDGNEAQETRTAEPCDSASAEGTEFAVAPVPCPTTPGSAAHVIDTTNYSDGEHELTHCADDFAGNETCTDPVTVRFDNRAVGLSPRGLTVAQGSDWRPDNAFDLSWQNPDQQGGSPIAAVRYRVRTAGDEGYDSGVQTIATGTFDRIDDLEVPEVGDYAVTVWLEDAAGNQSELDQSETVHVRYDDTAPGASTPTHYNGWLSRAEFPYAQTWTHPGTSGPSGIKGYAVSIDRDPGADPCQAADRCTDAQTNHRPESDRSETIPNLPESTGQGSGHSYVHVVAVSGSGLRSSGVQTTELKVDRTDPATTLSGAPSEWTNQPALLTAEANDALSGMESAPGSFDPQPFTAIGVDGGSPVIANADTVSTSVASEGVHTISYYARDLAGNVNDGRTNANGVRDRDPDTATVRIDRTPPSLAFIGARDPQDPTLVRAPITDSLSGPAGGQIQYRATGATEWNEIPTQLVDGELRGRFPADDEPDGIYELQATGVDVAGNRTTTDRDRDGDPVRLTNPLKSQTVVRAGLNGGYFNRRRCHRRLTPPHRLVCRWVRRWSPGERRATTSFGQAARVTGELRVLEGEPIPNAPITVTESFDPGSTLAPRRHAAVTDSAGRFSVRLGSGTSRGVRVSYSGDRLLSRSASGAIRLLTRAKLSFGLSSYALRNGDTLLARGTVSQLFANPPPGGATVVVQFFDSRNHHWVGFGDPVQTRPNGAYRFAYRFTSITVAGWVRLRALVKQGPQWPYATSASRPRAVALHP